MSFEIRPIQKKNAFAVSEIEKLCFSKPWSENAVKSEMESDFSDFFGAFAQDELVGYIGGRTVADETEIFNVAVIPNFRRKGIAKTLIEKFIEKVRQRDTRVIFLEVRASNLSAITLYEKEGFVFCGLRKDYYTDPKENALLMRLAFDGTQEYEEWDDEE